MPVRADHAPSGADQPTAERRWAIFLRGINVGGVKVPMADLRSCLEELGLAEVRTVLNTGNVTGTSIVPEAALKEAVEAALSERFGYTAHVVLVPLERLSEIVAQCPYEPAADRHRYVIFCATDAARTELLSYADGLDPAVEAIAPGPGVVYWSCPKGSTLDTAFAKRTGSKALQADTTNRNLNTVEKLL